jgi:hypothetical protein
MKALHVPPGLGSGRAERMVANLMRNLDRERFEAGVISLLDPLFGTDLIETLAQDGIPVWHLGNFLFLGKERGKVRKRCRWASE